MKLLQPGKVCLDGLTKRGIKLRIGHWRKKCWGASNEVVGWHISAPFENWKSLRDKGYELISFHLVIIKVDNSFFLILKIFGENARHKSWEDYEVMGDSFRYECEERAQHFMNFLPKYEDVLNYHYDYKKRDDESKSYFE